MLIETAVALCINFRREPPLLRTSYPSASKAYVFHKRY